jgi:gliding motility-associated peptidyl-prolyl isomerase
MKIVRYSFTLVVLLISCNAPEPRRPISVKTGTFFKESVERNKKILALEEAEIKKIMKKDTTNTYYSSASGFWYYYHTKDSINTYIPKENDAVLIHYNVRTLANDTLYTDEDIGNVIFKIDKETPFSGLNAGLKLMKKGETVTFLFPSSLAYGYHGDGNKIGINVPLISTVSLIDIIQQSNDNSLKQSK